MEDRLPRTHRFLICIFAAAALTLGACASAEQSACIASSKGGRGSELALGAGGDTYMLNWIAQIDPGNTMNAVQVTDTLSPRSLREHDRLVIPGTPDDWIAAPDGRGLVLCHRKVKAVVVIKDHFCSAPLSERDVRNGEIEEITFVGGTTWLADDILAGAPTGSMPVEIAENIDDDFNAEYGGENPPNPGPAPDVKALLAKWKLVPMSKALGIGGKRARCN